MRPTKVNIFGHPIKIDWDKNLKDEKLFGCADRFNMVVSANPLTSSSQQKATVLHELLHIIWSLSGMKQRLDGVYNIPPGCLEFTEEEVVRAFENALFSLMKDNPKFMKWLLDEDTK